jgi:outer membrane protein assembly factor BamA
VDGSALLADDKKGQVRITLLLSLFLLFPFSFLFSQTTFRLHISPSEQEVFSEKIKDFRLKPIEKQTGIAEFQLPDSAALVPLCHDLLQHFRQKSFLAVSIDSLEQSAIRNQQSAILHLGPEMRWIQLRPANSDNEDWFDAARFREKLFSEKPFRHDELLRLEEAILQQAENNGYPFAQIWLDSVEVRPDGGVSAVLQIERGRFFVFKQLKINGDLKLPAAFLPNYLGLKPGDPYSRAQVLRIRDQMRTLLFLETTGNPTVTFAGNPAGANPSGEGEAMVNLFLQKKKASRFDFVIGLLPQSDANDGRLLLTGSLSAAFQNALNLGERFAVEFERLKPETQRLDVQASVPYLLGSPFGAEGRLNIFRRDSTWVDAQGEVGVSYLFTGGDYLKLVWENKSSSLQKVDTLSVLQTRRLPPNLDYRQNAYGLELGMNRLDYRFNPRKGWAIQVRSLAGFNTVRTNSQIENLRDPDDPEFSFASLYDTVTQRATRYRLEGKTELFVPLFQRTTLKLAVRGGGIFSEKPVYNNEQYRLGGNKLMRGFDEESLFATRYVVTTAELRLLIGLNSYLAAFADYGYLENVTRSANVFLHPLGIGAGLTFETQAGIFGISLAVGKRDYGEPMDFRALKFHIGYVSLF